MKNDNPYLQEATKLLSSERGDEFMEYLEKSVVDAIHLAKGTSHAQVESAVELTPEEKNKLAEFLTNSLHHEVGITYKVDPHLLGGIKIEVGDWKIDGTLVHQLDTMRHIIEPV